MRPIASTDHAFSGMWLDERDDIHVGLSEAREGLQEHLRGIVSQPERLHFDEHDYPLNELTQTHSLIVDQWESLLAEGVDLVGVGIPEDRNRVVVQVSESASDAEGELARRFPEEHLVVEESQPFSVMVGPTRFGPPPWVGGMNLIGTCLSSDCSLFDCSSAFDTHKHGEVLGVPTVFHYVTTAGHCFGLNTPVEHGAAGEWHVGTVTWSKWYSGSNCDCEAIGIEPGTHSHSVFNDSPYATGSVIGAIWPSVGMKICKSGITTGTTCGWTIRDTHFAVQLQDPGTGAGTNLINQIHAERSTFGVDQGDSGGAVFQWAATNQNIINAVGVMSGGTSDGRWMTASKIKALLNSFGAHITKTSDPG